MKFFKSFKQHKSDILDPITKEEKLQPKVDLNLVTQSIKQILESRKDLKLFVSIPQSLHSNTYNFFYIEVAKCFLPAYIYLDIASMHRDETVNITFVVYGLTKTNIILDINLFRPENSQKLLQKVSEDIKNLLFYFHGLSFFYVYELTQEFIDKLENFKPIDYNADEVNVETSKNAKQIICKLDFSNLPEFRKEYSPEIERSKRFDMELKYDVKTGRKIKF